MCIRDRDRRYSYIITTFHTLSSSKLSTMSSICSICGGFFKNLSKHINYKHVKSHKSFQCDICHERFTKSHDLISHKQRQHIERISCHLCDKTFKNHKNAKEHIKNIHEDKETFECEYCHKQFRKIWKTISLLIQKMLEMKIISFLWRKPHSNVTYAQVNFQVGIV